MSLLSALSISGSALAAQQAALQVTSNNIANASDPNYAEESIDLTPAIDTNESGQYIGTGVDITAIQRQVDEALNQRLGSSTSDNNSATTIQSWGQQIQNVFGTLNQQNLSTSMSSFFNSWSSLADNPTDVGQRQVVVQQGTSLAQQFNSVNGNLNDIASNLGSTINTTVSQVNLLGNQLASLNQQIATSQNGVSTDNSLLDQRDATIQSLAKLVNINSVQQPNNTVNVYIGSIPLITGSTNNGLGVTTTETNGQLQSSVVFKNDGGSAPVTSGQLGGLLGVQGTLTGTINNVNTLANNLVDQLNQLHSSGQGLTSFSSVTGTTQVADPTQPLASAAAGIPFGVNNGSFVVHVTDTSTGQTSSSLIQVQVGAGASPQTTLNSLVTSLNAVGGINASDAGGYLKISSTSPAFDFSFSQDSSGTLAALGVNTFFTGSDARTIGVNPTLSATPTLLAASGNGNAADNSIATQISQLASQPVTSLGGASLDQNYNSLVTQVGSTVSNATSDATATSNIQQALQAQQQSISGVSLDNEAINMIRQQRVYQGASLVINAVNQMMQSLLAAV